MANKMTGFKVYKGTKETFISSGKATANADAIVFITGGSDSSKSCIFAQGTYFANFTEFISAYVAAMNYVKGVTVGDASYNAAAGGGYVAFEAKNSDSEVTLNVTDGKVVIGLHDDFVNKVNGINTDLGEKDDTADKDGSAFARIANLAALVSDLTGGSTNSIESQITSAISELRNEIVGTLDTTDAKTLAAINDELNAIDAKWANYVLKSDLSEEVSDNAGVKVNVTVKTKDGKVSDVVVDETQLDAALNLKANAADVYTKTEAESMAQDKVDALANGAVKANTDAIAVLNGNNTVDGSVDKKIADAINAFAGSADGDNVIENVTELLAYVNGVDGSKTLAEAIADIAENKGKIATLNGDENTAGSVAKAVADEEARAEAAYAVKGTETVASGAAARAEEAYALAETKQTADQVSTAISGAINAIAEVSKTGDGTYVDVTVKTAKGSVTEVTVDDSAVKTYADGVGTAAKTHAETKISEAVGAYSTDGTASGLRKEIEERDNAVKAYADSLFVWEEL